MGSFNSKPIHIPTAAYDYTIHGDTNRHQAQSVSIQVTPVSPVSNQPSYQPNIPYNQSRLNIPYNEPNQSSRQNNEPNIPYNESPSTHVHSFDLAPPYDFEMANSDNLPPAYDFISSIPGGNCLLAENLPLTPCSKAKFVQEASGVYSNDPMLDSNTEELWSYFLTHMQIPPQMYLQCIGTHTVTTTTTSNGTVTTSTHTVTDFDFQINLSEFIDPNWKFIVAEGETKNPQTGTLEPATFQNTLEAYANCPNSLKEFCVRKRIAGWDLNRFTANVRMFIIKRCPCFSSTCIKVKINLKNHKIDARSSSDLQQFQQSMVTRILCFLTCLCIFFYPFVFASRMIVKKVTANYALNRSEGEVFHRILPEVFMGVGGRKYKYTL